GTQDEDGVCGSSLDGHLCRLASSRGDREAVVSKDEARAQVARYGDCGNAQNLCTVSKHLTTSRDRSRSN
ncbi:MAG TPA: hypothetical protein VGE93_15090, partial [Bryobacteraceae bacterium]